jgi:hypothetical protein
MKERAMHVTEEELILHYYGEAPNGAAVDDHLTSCAACRAEFSRLQQALALVDTDTVPDPGPGFERRVWARLEPQLQVEPRTSWFSWLMPTPARLAWVAGAAAVIVAAFVAGRVSGPAPAPVPGPNQASAATSEASNDGVLVLAVVDHLDRSQMVLVELMNSDLDRPVVNISSEQSRARDLVAANRLYRASAAQAGDDTTGDVLDELERVLIEIANAPEDASKAELDALRARIASRGLLFRVRVVNSEMRLRERQLVGSGQS